MVSSGRRRSCGEFPCFSRCRTRTPLVKMSVLACSLTDTASPTNTHFVPHIHAPLPHYTIPGGEQELRNHRGRVRSLWETLERFQSGSEVGWDPFFSGEKWSER